MFKRARWLTAGAAVGFGGSVWLQRRLRSAVSRYLPDEVAERAGARATRARTDLREAIDEGRTAMRQREQELRSRLLPGERRGGPSIEARHRHLHVLEGGGEASGPAAEPAPRR